MIMMTNTEKKSIAAFAAQAKRKSLNMDIGSMKQLFRSLAFFGVLGLLPSTAVNAATYLFHNDHLGTPQALTDTAQGVVWKSVQDPFGEITQTQNEVKQNIRFPGQYYDVETGLHYNYHRDFDPRTGRYIQSDPIGLEAGVNTFGYVAQNPLRYSDPLGLDLVVVVGLGHTKSLPGHAALAVTGSGVFSHGTNDSFAGSFSGYLKFRTNLEHSMLIEFKNLSSEQEKSIVEKFRNEYLDGYNPFTNNCSTVIHNALEDTVGFPFNLPRTLGMSTPANLKWRAEIYSSMHGGTSTFVKKGSQVPAWVSKYDP